jgi:hypothetical protein
MNVVAVKESEWDKDGTIVKVTTVKLDDGREVPGYDLPSVPEVGKPLPAGWEIATAKSGKLYIKVPKAGGSGGAAAYRNTKEGQAYEQERMDRRTALMQAVALAPGADGAQLQALAEGLYSWLRAPLAASGGPSGKGGTDRRPSADTPAPVQTGPTGEGARTASLPGTCPKCGSEALSDQKPDGSPLPARKARCIDCRTVYTREAA